MTSGKTIQTVLGIAVVVLGYLYISHLNSQNDWMAREVHAGQLLDAKRYDEAIAEYTKLIDELPNSEYRRNQRGRAYEAKGDIDKALEDYSQAIAIAPGDKRSHYDRGRMYVLKGEPDKALDDFTAALAEPKPWDEAYAARAGLRYTRGDIDGALADYAMAMKATPYRADNAFNRGRIELFERNAPVEAAEDLAVALKAAFDYRGSAELLRGMGGDPGSGELMDNHHPFVPDGYYLMIWLHVARAHANQKDDQELQANWEELKRPIFLDLVFKKFEDTRPEVEARTLAPWPGAIIGLHLGLRSLEKVRAEAEAASDPAQRARRICDVDFYLGEYQLQHGDRAAAQTLLQSAADHCPADARELGFARVELKRLAP